MTKNLNEFNLTNMPRVVGVGSPTDLIQGKKLNAHVDLANKGVRSNLLLKIQDDFFLPYSYDSPDSDEVIDGNVEHLSLSFSAPLAIIPESSLEFQYEIRTQLTSLDDEFDVSDDDGSYQTKRYRYLKDTNELSENGGGLSKKMYGEDINERYDNNVDYINDLAIRWVQSVIDDQFKNTHNNHGADTVGELIMMFQSVIYREISKFKIVINKGHGHRGQEIYRDTAAPFIKIGDLRSIVHENPSNLGRLQISVERHRDTCEWNDLLRSFPIEIMPSVKMFRDQLLEPAGGPSISHTDDTLKVLNTGEGYKPRPNVTCTKDIIPLEELRDQELLQTYKAISKMVVEMMSEENGVNFSSAINDVCRTLVELPKVSDHDVWVEDLKSLKDMMQYDESNVSLPSDGLAFQLFLDKQEWTMPVSPIQFAISKTDFILGRDMANNLDVGEIGNQSPSP